jgi:hypothetical protein
LVLTHNNRTVIAHQATHSGSVFSLNGIPAVASDRGFVLINYFGTFIIQLEAVDALLAVAHHLTHSRMAQATW